MAEENTGGTQAASTASTAPKRKTTARKSSPRKTAAKRSTASKTATRKTAARKTTRAGTARAKSAPRKTAARKASPDLAARVQEASRSAFLASLGFYGKAFDQVQEQFTTVQSQLEARRKKADKLYAELVKRGEKVEKQARSAIDDIDLPRLEFTSIADRKRLEARLEKARKRFAELRDSVSFGSAA
jgi:uncharacterized coiled-coil DUF342 family protein